jgi:hypothetical protein
MNPFEPCRHYPNLDVYQYYQYPVEKSRVAVGGRYFTIFIENMGLTCMCPRTPK